MRESAFKDNKSAIATSNHQSEEVFMKQNKVTLSAVS
jgi:hypothetical protein